MTKTLQERKEALLEQFFLIITSPTFWLITFSMAANYASTLHEIGFNWADLFNQLYLWIGAIAGVGILNKAAEKFSAKKVEVPKDI